MARPEVTQLARAAVRSRRVQLSLLTNVLSSLGNFSVSIAVARQETIADVGLFAVATATYALAVGAVRAGFAETALALDLGAGPLRTGARSVSGVAAVVGLVVAAVGLVSGNPYLAVMGAALHGLCLYEYVKASSLARLSPAHALAMEAAWFAVTVPVAVAAIAGAVEPLVAFAAWTGGGAVVGYVTCLLVGFRILPSVRATSVPWRTSAPYVADFLVGSGSAQVAVNVLSATAGTAVAGSLRSATTLFGPAGLVLTSARTLIIRHLGRGRGRGGGRSWRPAAMVALVLTVPMTPVLVTIAVLPDAVGEAVLGANWSYAAPLMPLLSVEMFFSTLAAVAYAGHKALLVGRQTIAVRSVLAVARIGGVVVGGVTAGAFGAAVAMAAVSALGCVLWWVAYVRGVRTGAAVTEE